MRPSTNDDLCLSPVNLPPALLDTQEPNVDLRHLRQLGDQYLRWELEMRVPGQAETPVVVEVATPIEPSLLLVYWCC